MGAAYHNSKAVMECGIHACVDLRYHPHAMDPLAAGVMCTGTVRSGGVLGGDRGFLWRQTRQGVQLVPAGGPQPLQSDTYRSS